MRNGLNEEQLETRIIGDEKNSKYIVYTADGTEFHLKQMDGAQGTMENGDIIMFHPENIIAIRTKSQV